MFHQRPLGKVLLKLRLGRRQLRFRPGYVQPGNDAATMQALGQVHRFGIRISAFFQQLRLLIETAQAYVAVGQLGLQAQARIGQIGFARLRFIGTGGN